MAAPKSPASSQTGKRVLYALLSLLLAGGLLYYSLQGIDWSRVGQVLATAKPPLVLAVCLMFSANLFFRAVRWRVLLLAEGQVTVPAAFWATSAGYFGNNFLPARAGELIRTFMIGAKAHLSKTFVLTTALSERVADAITLVTISSITLLGMEGSRPGWLGDAAMPFALLGICGVLGIALAPLFARPWRFALAKAPLSDSLKTKLDRLFEQFLLGIRSFHDRGRLARFLGLTLIVWLIDATAVVVGGYALGIAIGPAAALLLITGLGLGSALPSTPGYVGIYQFVAVSILTPFGISRTDAIAYILFAQAVQYVLITGWGLVGILQYQRLKHAVPLKMAS